MKRWMSYGQRIFLVYVLFFVGALEAFGGGQVDGEDEESVQYLSYSVPLDGTLTEARISLLVGRAHLRIANGSQKLVDAQYQYAGNRPRFHYMKEGSRGLLRVRQPFLHYQDRSFSYWDLTTHPMVPVSIEIHGRSGDYDLDLKGVPVRSVDVDLRSGDTNLDLSGELPVLESVEVDSRSGATMANMPGNYRKLEALTLKTRSGQVGVDFSGKAGRLQKMSFFSTSGDIRAILTGRWPQLKILETQSTSGDQRVDLRGTWERDCYISVSATSGDSHITVPSDVGVRVMVATTSGTVKANSLQAKGRSYVNTAYGRSPVTLEIKVSSTSGDILIKTPEN